MFDSLDAHSLTLIGWLMLGAALCGWLLLDPRWEDHPRDARRVSGLLTAGLGIVAALAVVFAPLYTQTTSEPSPSSDGTGETVETTTRLSLWDQGLPPEFALTLAVFAALLIMIGRCAVPVNRDQSRDALVVLWIAAFALLGAVAITIMTVGLFLLPVALLAFVTAIHATRARNRYIAESDQGFQHSGI